MAMLRPQVWSSRVHALLLPPGSDAVPVWPLWKGQDTGHLPAPALTWMESSKFEAKPGRVLIVPGEGGALLGAVLGVEAPDAKSRDPFLTANLVRDLPAGAYRFEGALADPRLAVIGF